MYIIMDLDATLLNDNRKVTDYSVSILTKLKNDGHIIVLNTARSLDATLPIIDVVNPQYSILNGGALIVSGKEKIYENVVSNEIVQKVIDEIKLNDIEEFSVQCDEGLFTNKESYPLTNAKATYFDYSEKFIYNASKILLCSQDGILPKKLSEKYNLKITHYVNGPWYRLSTCNKQDGNIALFKLLGDENPQSICFGDDIGDLEMLEEASIGVALSNSVDSVLSVITNVTKYSNDEDGVAKYLEEYFYIKKKNTT